MTIAILSAALLAAGLGFGAKPNPAQDFERRVNDYLKIRRQACSKIAKLRNDAEPAEISANKKAQADAIRAARSSAAQGEIFTPEISNWIRSRIASYMKGPGKVSAEKAVEQGNPATEGGIEKLRLEVNAAYPSSVPLSTVPPGILLRLPKLPKQLDYRFVGHTLLLHDADAGIIIDFLPNAIP